MTHCGFAPSAVAYVVGMAEVAVGLGAQLGRLGGGGLYDLGGFGCPFLTTSLSLGLAKAVERCYGLTDV